MAAAAVLAVPATPLSLRVRAPVETGSFASPPRGEFALGDKLCVMRASRNCLAGQTCVRGDNVRSWRQRAELETLCVCLATPRRSWIPMYLERLEGADHGRA